MKPNSGTKLPNPPALNLGLLKRRGRRWKPPAYLAPATRRWFAEIELAFELESHHVRLLTLAGEAWDEGQRRGRSSLRRG